MFNIFIRFLKDNNCYTQYQRNLKKYLSIVKKFDKLHYVIAAFTWSETKEGIEFWNDIDMKWRIKL